MPKKAAEPTKPEPTEEAGVPIIVRRAIMKDEVTAATPTSTDEATKTEDASNPIEVKSKKSRIEPLAPSAEEPKPEAPAATEKPVAAAEPAKPATAAVAPASKPEKAAEEISKPTDGPEEFTLAGEDSVATPDDPSQNPIDQAKAKADKEAAEKQAALDKLVDAQTYFLPLNSVEKRRTKQLFFVTMLLLVVLAAAGAFWANGQGYITIPGL